MGAHGPSKGGVSPRHRKIQSLIQPHLINSRPCHTSFPLSQWKPLSVHPASSYLPGKRLETELCYISSEWQRTEASPTVTKACLVSLGIYELKHRRTVAWAGSTTGSVHCCGVNQSSSVTGDRDPVQTSLMWKGKLFAHLAEKSRWRQPQLGHGPKWCC